MQGKGEAAPPALASGFAQHQSLGPRHFYERRHPLSLRARYSFSERRDSIVSAPFVVELGCGTVAGFANQSLFQHPLDRSVERSCTQSELAASALLGYVLLVRALARRKPDVDVAFLGQ